MVKKFEIRLCCYCYDITVSNISSYIKRGGQLPYVNICFSCSFIPGVALRLLYPNNVLMTRRFWTKKF